MAGVGIEFAAQLSRLKTAATGVRTIVASPTRRWRVIAPLLLLVVGTTALAYYAAFYHPLKQSSQQTLQTAIARRGTIVLSASGTGTLQGANQADLAFNTSGTLASLGVKVGDQVSSGQVIAALDNTSQQLQYDQAKVALDSLTSTSAIGSAQQAVAQATQKLLSAQLQVEYLISPETYYWENEVNKDTQAANDAQAAAAASPSDAALQAKLKRAQDVLGFAQDKLKGSQKNYHDYVIDTFTVHKYNHLTGTEESYIGYPTAAEITKARQDVVIAQGALTEAQNLYSALTGGTLPSNASGSALLAFEDAQLALKTAEENLKATQLIAPFAGTVTAVEAHVGDAVGSSAVVSIADLSHLFLKTYIDESDYDKFKVGNTADVVFDALPEETLTGKVTQVDPTLDTSSGSPVVSGLVELDPTSADLLIGMGGSVEVIASEAQNVTVVPLTTLHEYAPGKYQVFVVKNGAVTAQPVEIGLQDLVNVEIKSGLQPGDVVSTSSAGTAPQ